MMLNLAHDVPHETLRDVVVWGTYGKEGSDPLRRVTISEMSNDHIGACIREAQGSGAYQDLFRAERAYRKANNIQVLD